MFYSIHSQEKKLERETKNITLCLYIMFTEKTVFSLSGLFERYLSHLLLIGTSYI